MNDKAWAEAMGEEQWVEVSPGSFVYWIGLEAVALVETRGGVPRLTKIYEHLTGADLAIIINFMEGK